MEDRKQPIIKQSGQIGYRDSFRSNDIVSAADSSYTLSGGLEMNDNDKTENSRFNNFNNSFNMKHGMSLKDGDNCNNNSNYHESFHKGQSFIKMAKSSKFNSKTSFSRTGFTNKEVRSPENYSMKSSFIGSSLHKYVNFLIPNKTNNIKPKNLYGKFNTMIHTTRKIFDESDKKAPYSNRSMTNRFYNKTNLSERAFSENKLDILNSNRHKVDFSVLSGERLYRKGMATIERSMKKLNIIKCQKYKKEMKECSFRPKLLHSPIYLNMNILNRNNIIDSSSNNRNMYFSDNENMGYKKKDKKIKKYDSTNRYQANDKICHNIISRTSRLKSADISKIRKPEEELIKLGCRFYNEAERLRVNKEKLVEEYYNQNYPFQPKLINSTSKPSVYNFFHRLQGWVDKRNEKYLNDIEKNKYDEKTGLRLFSPNIIKDRLNNEVYIIKLQ